MLSVYNNLSYLYFPVFKHARVLSISLCRPVSVLLASKIELKWCSVSVWVFVLAVSTGNWSTLSGTVALKYSARR